MKDMSENTEIKQINTKVGDRIAYAEFFGWKSKSLIHEVDARLADSTTYPKKNSNSHRTSTPNSGYLNKGKQRMCSRLPH